MRVVLATGRIPGRPGQAVRAVLNGVLLGVMSEDRLRALDEHYYDVDVMYRTTAWNERGLSAWERGAVQRTFPPGSRIVVPACGGGREVLALLDAGFDAIGYESHPGLVGFAERFLADHGHPGRAFAVARDRFPPEAGSWDGVLVGWGGYSLIAPRAARVSFLRDAGSATELGGALMLSCFARPAHGRELRVTARVARALQRGRTGSMELGDTLAPNRVHVFTRAELDAELREAGLVLDSYATVSVADGITSYVCAIGRHR